VGGGKGPSETSPRLGEDLCQESRECPPKASHGRKKRKRFQESSVARLSYGRTDKLGGRY